jgi:hypothetical protein
MINPYIINTIQQNCEKALQQQQEKHFLQKIEVELTQDFSSPNDDSPDYSPNYDISPEILFPNLLVPKEQMQPQVFQQPQQKPRKSFMDDIHEEFLVRDPS